MWLQNSCHMRSAACRVYFKFKTDLKNWNKLQFMENTKTTKSLKQFFVSVILNQQHAAQNRILLHWGDRLQHELCLLMFLMRKETTSCCGTESPEAPPPSPTPRHPSEFSLGRVIETHKVPFSVPTHQMALWLRLGTNTTWLGAEDWWRLVELRHQTSFHTGHKHQSSGSRCDPPLNPYLHPLLGPSCFYSCRCSDRLILTRVFALEVVWSPVRLVRLVHLDEMQRDMTEYNKSSPLLT